MLVNLAQAFICSQARIFRTFSTFSYKIDFGGEIGIKKSCAQLPQNYTKEQLKNKLVLGVVNFPPRQIGPAVSETLTLGVPDENGEYILITPDKPVSIGGELY